MMPLTKLALTQKGDVNDCSRGGAARRGGKRGAFADGGVSKGAFSTVTTHFQSTSSGSGLFARGLLSVCGGLTPREV